MCETWSLTLREEHRLRVFEYRVLRGIFGPKRDEVTGGWRKLHNEDLHNLYCSPSIIRIIKSRRMRWPGHVARMGDKRNACRILVGKPEGKRPLGRSRRRWEDNIRMDLREIGWSGMDWTDMMNKPATCKIYLLLIKDESTETAVFKPCIETDIMREVLFLSFKIMMHKRSEVSMVGNIHIHLPDYTES
jgi:hypothetical protein